MIPIYDKTQVARDSKIWHWLQNLQPDRTVQLISTTDNCYRSSDDDRDDDRSDSMPVSEGTRVIAGGSDYLEYTSTLEQNRIINGKINLETYELDVTFTDKVRLPSEGSLQSRRFDRADLIN
jgi:hypothetical protein